MQFAALLEEARTASPQDRIQWRDKLATYGARAIDGVKPWLLDSTLAAFAIRVIWRVGETGAPSEATAALRAVRGKLSPALQGDVDWALLALKRASADAAKQPVVAPVEPAKRAIARERPLNSRVVRRRSS